MLELRDHSRAGTPAIGAPVFGSVRRIVSVAAWPATIVALFDAAGADGPPRVYHLNEQRRQCLL